jgi:hypothetical protein
MEEGMEQAVQPQAQPQAQPQVQSTYKSESKGIMDMNLKTIVYAIVGGVIVGFSIGAGFLIAQKVLSKTILDKKEEPKVSLSNFDGETAKMPMPRQMPRGQRPRRQSGMNLNGGRLF